MGLPTHHRKRQWSQRTCNIRRQKQKVAKYEPRHHGRLFVQRKLCERVCIAEVAPNTSDAERVSASDQIELSRMESLARYNSVSRYHARRTDHCYVNRHKCLQSIVTIFLLLRIRLSLIRINSLLLIVWNEGVCYTAFWLVLTTSIQRHFPKFSELHF